MFFVDAFFFIDEIEWEGWWAIGRFHSHKAMAFITEHGFNR
ncbi:MAG: hypothetical protein ACTSVM_00755 [Candidatus Ranarchaeia archaeon]